MLDAAATTDWTVSLYSETVASTKLIRFIISNTAGSAADLPVTATLRFRITLSDSSAKPILITG